MKKSFNHPYDKVYTKCKEALKRLEMTVESSNKETGLIKASTESSLLSWGENIRIKITRNENRTSVSVKSETSSQLFTWGKNSTNESSILNELSKRLKS